MNNFEDKVTNVHEAMVEAALESAPAPRLVSASYKVDPQAKEVAESICERHGTNLSAFLRQCVMGLIKDYTPGQL